jgi:hypothetical protein
MLYRNDNGSFTDVSIASGIAAPDGNYALGAVATDVDRDGWPDLYVALERRTKPVSAGNRLCRLGDSVPRFR